MGGVGVIHHQLKLNVIYLISFVQFLNPFKMSEDWKSSLFGCCGDCGTCCCVTWCSPCAAYKDAEDLNKPGILYGLLACFIPCVPIMLLRGEAREKYGIEGSVAGDAMAAWCCTYCAQCQVGSEIKERGDRS